MSKLLKRICFCFLILIWGCLSVSCTGVEEEVYIPSDDEIDLVLEEGETYHAGMGLGISLKNYELSVDGIVTVTGDIICGTGEGKTCLTYGDGDLLKIKVVRRHDLDTFISFDRGKMYGKKFVIYGDSISARATLQTGQKDWKDYLQQELGFTYECFAVSGSLFSYQYSHESIVPARKCGCEYIEENGQANQDADYALIWYGTNDFSCNVPIGNSVESDISADQTDSLKSSICYAVKRLRKDNPDIKLIFLTQLYRDDLYNDGRVINGVGVSLQRYVNAVKELSDELGYTVLDMFPLFSHEDFQAGGIYTKDGLHPNEDGHRVISDFLLGLNK